MVTMKFTKNHLSGYMLSNKCTFCSKRSVATWHFDDRDNKVFLCEEHHDKMVEDLFDEEKEEEDVKYTEEDIEEIKKAMAKASKRNKSLKEALHVGHAKLLRPIR